jgi:AhpD family alkylhydroperoxidase
MHTQRLSLQTVPKAYAALAGVEQYLRSCGLEKSLMTLLKMRASQINGCAFCLDMHSREAHEAGETEQRLHLLPAWRDSPLYTERERAALAWTECLTRLYTDGAPDDVYAALKAQFSDVEIGNLTTLIAQINTWNRLCVGLRVEHPVRT